MPSSAIRRFRYEPETRTLVVTFVSGEDYAYADVPPEVSAAFREAFSKGRFFQTHVRDRYRYRRLSDGPRAWRPPTADPPRP